jgi:hypothetical protein
MPVDYEDDDDLDDEEDEEQEEEVVAKKTKKRAERSSRYVLIMAVSVAFQQMRHGILILRSFPTHRILTSRSVL